MNLILRQHDDHGCLDDLKVIQSWFRRNHPSVRVSICGERLSPLERIRHHRAILISFLPFGGKGPIGGHVFCGRALTKSEECQQLQEAGLPVPTWHVWNKDEPKPDLTELGPYIVRKPNRGARGAEIMIVRSDRVQWRELEVAYASIRSEPFFQEFIYTGTYPESYRVGTFFGRPIYSFKVKRDAGTLPLLGRHAFKNPTGVGSFNIVANSKMSTYVDCKEPDVLDLARQAHSAFPEIPLLGVDILRDATTGKLWVIEVNASGYTWHFSSPLGRSIQERHHLDFKAQFGGLEQVAHILAQQFDS